MATAPDLQPLLLCPAGRASLSRLGDAEDEGYFCSDPTHQTESFPMAADISALVNFSASIFSRAAFEARFGSNAFIRSLTNKIATLMSAPFCRLRYFDRFCKNDYAADAANGVYFLGRRSTMTLAPRGMIAYYPGPRT